MYMLYPRKTLAPDLRLSKIHTLSLMVTLLHLVYVYGCRKISKSRQCVWGLLLGLSPEQDKVPLGAPGPVHPHCPPCPLPLLEPHSHASPLLQPVRAVAGKGQTKPGWREAGHRCVSVQEVFPQNGSLLSFLMGQVVLPPCFTGNLLLLPEGSINISPTVSELFCFQFLCVK